MILLQICGYLELRMTMSNSMWLLVSVVLGTSSARIVLALMDTQVSDEKVAWMPPTAQWEGLCHAPLSFAVCQGWTTEPRVQRRRRLLNLLHFNVAPILASLTQMVQMVYLHSEECKLPWHEERAPPRWAVCVEVGKHPSQTRFHVAAFNYQLLKEAASRR